MIWIAVVCIVVGVVMAIVQGRMGFRGEGWRDLSIVWTVIWVCLVLVGVGLRMNSELELRNMIALYDSNVPNYQVAIDKTQALLSVDVIKGSLLDGSVEKTNLAVAVSNRMAEYRDAANTYNASLNEYNHFSRSFWFSFFYPLPPEYLKPILIQ